MKVVDVRALSAADTAVMLRAKLGPLRSWPDFLSDNIRGKQHISGHTLLPCSRVKLCRSLQPFYALSDIETFIAEVLADIPEAGKKPLKPITLTIDRHRPWRLNKFNARGAPMAWVSTSSH